MGRSCCWLPTKGLDEDLRKCEATAIVEAGHADLELVLRDVQPQCPVQTVPQREQRGKVRVPFLADD